MTLAGLQSNGALPLPKTTGSSVKDYLQSDKQVIVLKIGTSSLVRPELHTLNLTNLARICETVKALHMQGHHVIIVSSGAVGVGCQCLGLSERPTALAKKQALAAVGQVHLMRFYEDFLSALGLRCAQVLLTLDNLAQRSQYLNARNTFAELLAYGAIPVVNENDTVAVQNLRFGDNDTLSAQVAALVEADWLFLMTDVDCLFTANPKDDPNAQPLWEVEDISRLNADTSTKGTQWGTGGMATKLTAGRIATAAGCNMVICSSEKPECIPKMIAGEPKLGTLFHARKHALRGRKRWLLSVPVRGTLRLSAGAVRAVRDKRKALFIAGITKVEGDFHAQDAVSIRDEDGVEIGRGLANFAHEEIDRLRGKSSREFAALLGYNAQAEVVHKMNLALLSGADESDHDGDDETGTEDDCPTPSITNGYLSPKAAAAAQQIAVQVEAGGAIC